MEMGPAREKPIDADARDSILIAELKLCDPTRQGVREVPTVVPRVARFRLQVFPRSAERAGCRGRYAQAARDG
jgi:hypothetical protein